MKKRDTVRRRRKSFFAVLAAMLMVINLLPMNAFATTYILGDNITVNSNQLICPGDSVQFTSSGNVIIDGGNPVYKGDGDKYENADTSGKYYIGTKESGANNLLLSSVYKVNFDTDGGSAAPADQYIAKNSLVTEPAADPTKDNFTFDKWMLSGQDGEGNPTYSDWDFATDTVQNSTTFVAKWLPNYTVAYDPNGGTGTMNNQARVFDDGALLTANAFTRTGYTFNGWNTAANGSGTAYVDSAAGNLSSTAGDTVTLYAQWTPINYTITFDPDGGSAVAAQVKAYGSKAVKPADPTKEGYTFDKWVTKTAGNATANDPSNLVETEWNFDTDTVTGDVILYAKWTKNQAEETVNYKVTFDTDGGSAVAAQTVTSGAKALKPADPTKEGYTFDKWVTKTAGNGVANDPSNVVETEWNFDTDTVNADVTLYAKWTENQAEETVSYTVTFDANGGSAVEAQTVEAGGKAVKPADPARAGYIFGGWYLVAQDGSENAYDFDSAVNSDITLKAKYTFNKDSLDDSISQLDINEGYTDFTDDLKGAGFDTEDKVRNSMYRVVAEELDIDTDKDEAELLIGSKLYDVDFLVSFDDGKTWEIVTAETFPEDGLWVEMDYPEGTDAKTNNFLVAHMFTHNMRGHKAGETETMVPEKNEKGIRFKVSSLSPVLVTWSLAATGVTVTPKDSTLTAKGETVQLTATVVPAGAIDKSVTWSSSDTSVATVDANGKVTAVAEGNCIITATTNDGGNTDTANVTVKFASQTNTSSDNTSNNTSSDNTSGNSALSRAPKTGGDYIMIYVMIICLVAGVGAAGYGIYARRKR